ncbi:hypothetical protein FN846DRAFT_909093 [Sphaerosporella brunnea]|uniref:Cysteine-rich transmembrane CYSTM domain-containing protein n=1 Tax=Sphaerosporella brunnea TaxID=1250544 RepID=A0A5J5ERK0_9PEZI|nr:hypothetical protein FN846DRAFT_909093 [Sphaerosporella brunnea]
MSYAPQQGYAPPPPQAYGAPPPQPMYYAPQPAYPPQQQAPAQGGSEKGFMAGIAYAHASQSTATPWEDKG